jgi:urease accessory protein UreH
MRASGFRGNPVVATFMLYSPNMPPDLVDRLRAEIDFESSAHQKTKAIHAITRPEPELILVRYMGQSTAEVSDYFVRLWQISRPYVNGYQAVIPRIWNT